MGGQNGDRPRFPINEKTKWGQTTVSDQWTKWGQTTVSDQREKLSNGGLSPIGSSLLAPIGL
jgi:hypothetical protein